MGWLSNKVIACSDSNWEPSLLAFWINSFGHVIISINLLKDFHSHIRLSGSESLEEDDLEVAVVVIEISVVGWRALSSKGNVSIGKVH